MPPVRGRLPLVLAKLAPLAVFRDAGTMKRMRGFTLLELITTVTVMGVLLAIAIPSFRTMMLNARRSDVANNLVVAMTLARSESLKRNLSVRVCAAVADVSPQPATCASGSSTNWKNGWTVQVCTSGDSPCSTWQVLREFAPPPESSIVVGKDEIDFAGLSRQLALGDTGTIYVCDSRGASYGRKVVVNSAMRVRVDTTNSCS